MTTPAPTLPPEARLPINRCNLPAVILGSRTFQQHPAPLLLDGVAELHRELFTHLDTIETSPARAEYFHNYMVVHFRLESPEDAGYTPGGRRRRNKADYLRQVRGWSFDAESREGAVLKGWAESRFGLLPRFHQGRIATPGDEQYMRFQRARSVGLYNTNALESQLDLLYTFCQYELRRRLPAAQTHLSLFRGTNNLDDYETLEKLEKRQRIVLLNNLNSFTDNRERAEEFGDYIMRTEIPLEKIFFFNRLLPGMLKAEDEYVVIGGVYQVEIAIF